MNFELSSDQLQLQAALEQMTARHKAAPSTAHGYVLFNAELQGELADSGFFDLFATEGYGPLDAAMLVEAMAQLPGSIEVMGSALVRPALGIDGEGPVAVTADLSVPIRCLPQAKLLIWLDGDSVRVGAIEPGDVEPVGSVIAYPLGRYVGSTDKLRRIDADAASLRMWWQIGIAAEAAGLMRAALDLVVAYVKDRRAFGHPIGDFQAIQHRLAQDVVTVQASKNLALRAAYTGNATDAAIAALYAQKGMRSVIYDCHQFMGAMGVTLEFPLHLWTYRLKFIQGELGGVAAQGLSAAAQIWGAEMGATATIGASI